MRNLLVAILSLLLWLGSPLGVSAMEEEASTPPSALERAAAALERIADVLNSTPTDNSTANPLQEAHDLLTCGGEGSDFIGHVESDIGRPLPEAHYLLERGEILSACERTTVMRYAIAAWYANRAYQELINLKDLLKKSEVTQ